MDSNGDILVLIMGLVRMIILERVSISWLGSWRLSRITQRIGG